MVIAGDGTAGFKLFVLSASGSVHELNVGVTVVKHASVIWEFINGASLPFNPH